MTEKKPAKYKKFMVPRLKKTVGIGSALSPLIKRSFGKRGFQNSAILTDWDMIVGKRLVKYSVAERILYKKAMRTQGVLHIKVFGAMATEFDHQSNLIIEKINQYMGYKAVGSIKLHHTQEIPARDDKLKKEKTVLKITPDDFDEQGLHDVIDGLEEGALKEQLTRIGKHVFKK